MSEVSPERIIDALFAYRTTAALKAAIGLDLFSIIAAGATDVEAIAQRAGASARGVRILADYLCVEGFLQKTGETYELTPTSRVFLDRASPAYLGSIADFMTSPEHVHATLGDPLGYVRRGGSNGLGIVAPENPLWVTFARAMMPFIVPVAEQVVQHVRASGRVVRKLVDIAAGHGMFGIAIAKAVPTAEITAIDWPNVLAVARENAEKHGVAARYHTASGSAFDVDWGVDNDLVLIPNFLHHFDRETCIQILERARRSINASGRVLVIEFVPNADRVSPPFPARFAFIMLAETPGGDAYTADELAAMGQAAGLRNVKFHPLPPTPQTLVAFSP